MNSSQPTTAARTGSAVLLLAAAGYLALGALGLRLAIPPGYASPIFPAAGFAVAVLLWSDKRAWPGIALGSFLLNLGVAWLQGELGWGSGLIAAGIAGGSTLQALAAWWMLARRVGWQTLEVERDIILALALAGPLACAIAASIAVTLLCWTGIIPAQDYLYTWWNWWSGDTLGVLVMLPLTLTLLYRRHAPWRARLTTLVLPMLLALALVGGVFLAVAQWESGQQKLVIQNHGAMLAQRLEQRFVAHQEALSALRRVLELTPDMSYRQFEYFTRMTLKDNPDIFALSINPYVPLTQRHAFERGMAQKTGVAGFQIAERDSQRRLVRAADREEYVVVASIAPLEGNRPALGFDINSEPLRHAAIMRARRSGEPAVTAPIHLVQENRQRVGVLLLHPAHHQGQAALAAKAALMGFAVGVIKVDQMVEIATGAAAVSGLQVRLDDPQADAGRSLLYVSNPAADAPGGEYLWQRQLAMADRNWTLSVYPTPEFLRQRHHWIALAVGAGGLTLAALLQMLLLVTTGRTALVQRQVRLQTAELSAKSEALADRNAQLSALFALCPDGFVAFAHDGRIKFANAAFETMTGIELAEVVGRDEAALDAQLRQRCERPEAYIGVAACFGTSASGLVQVMVNLKLPRQAVLQLVGIRSGASSVSRILYLRDVTHETEVDHMKSEFLSTAAHELRTPMASIYGFAEVLATQALDEASRQEFLDIILRQSELIAAILNELLDLARIEARRGKDFNLARIDLRALLAEIIKGFKPPEGRDAPAPPVAEAPLWINADRKKLTQAVANVLSNAYKYSPEGGAVTIDFMLPEAGSTPARLGIRVSDRGLGMSPAQQARVFERFYRVDTSGKIPGTGLGMSIVQEIVNLHGGEVGVVSALGAGTAVTLWLPGAEKEAPP